MEHRITLDPDIISHYLMDRMPHLSPDVARDFGETYGVPLPESDLDVMALLRGTVIPTTGTVLDVLHLISSLDDYEVDIRTEDHMANVASYLSCLQADLQGLAYCSLPERLHPFLPERSKWI